MTVRSFLSSRSGSSSCGCGWVQSSDLHGDQLTRPSRSVRSGFGAKPIDGSGVSLSRSRPQRRGSSDHRKTILRTARMGGVSLLDAGDEEQPAGQGRLPYGECLGVIARGIPAPETIHGGELDHDPLGGRPVTFRDLWLRSPDDVSAAGTSDGGRSTLPVALTLGFVEDLHLGDHVGGHAHDDASSRYVPKDLPVPVGDLRAAASGRSTLRGFRPLAARHRGQSSGQTLRAVPPGDVRAH